MVGPRPNPDNPWDEPEVPLSDEQTKAQVVGAAREVVRAVPLQEVTGAFHFGSCNDQGDPPFQGVAAVTFKLPAGTDTEAAKAYFQKVIDVMAGLGWDTGGPPGQKVHGAGLNRNGVLATVGHRPAHPGYGALRIYGECRNMTEHSGVTDVSITSELG